jgi:hypothetical protein
MIPIPEAFIRDEDESWPIFLDDEEEDMQYEQEVMSLRDLCLTVILQNLWIINLYKRCTKFTI